MILCFLYHQVNYFRVLHPLYLMLLFTCESSYCSQRVLDIAILSVRLSVRLSVTRVDQSNGER